MRMLGHAITERRFPKIIAERTPAIRVPLELASSRTDKRADDIATISHELRNSLSVVSNAARLLRQATETRSIDNARVLIERHVAQMCRHVDDLMTLASRSTGKPTELQRSHVDLRSILENAVAAIEPEMERRGHRLVVEQPADAMWVHADSARLEQVFSNLLINAAKYTPDGGEIVLTLERVDAFARLRVRDTGIGIDAVMLTRVFDLYAQAEAGAACSEGGRGIGLALVRDLVEQHGGTVHATSEGLGLGSAFTVTVPLLWANDQAATR
jgi:signal transduction histidine kinase